MKENRNRNETNLGRRNHEKINVVTSDLNPSVMCTSKSELIGDRLILIKLSKRIDQQCQYT